LAFENNVTKSLDLDKFVDRFFRKPAESAEKLKKPRKAQKAQRN